MSNCNEDKLVPDRSSIAKIISHLPPDSKLSLLRQLTGSAGGYPYFEPADCFSFEPQTRDFSLKNAWLLSEASNLAYEKEADVGSKLKSMGFSFRWFAAPKTDAEAYVATRDDYVWVIFRGTEPASLLDWLTDLLYFQKNLGKVRVHQGFHLQLLSLDKQGLGDYLKSVSVGKKVYFAGHSLGGSLAAYAGLHFTERNTVVSVADAQTYSFGALHVGNQTFADALKSPTFRVVNHQDIACRLPDIMDIYFPAGKLFYLNEQGKLDPGVTELPPVIYLDADLMTGHIMALVNNPGDFLSWSFNRLQANLDPILDHAPVDYSTHLWNNR